MREIKRYFGVLLAGAAVCAGALAELPYSILVTEETVSIHAEGREALRYRYAGVPFKPYVDRFFTPGGLNATRDEVPDHPHHHGLMFAIAVDGVNFWEEKAASGKQVHRGFENVRVEAAGAGFTQRLDWVGPDNALLLVEERRLTFRAGKDGAPMLTWLTRLTRPAEMTAAALSGSHYFGLGIRFPAVLDAVGRFLHSGGEAGEVVRGEEHLTSGTWCAYAAEEPGFTCAILGAEADLTGAPVWFTMPKPFAYLSATQNLYKAPVSLAPGETLELRYGVALWDRAAERGEIEAAHAAWLDAPAPR